MSVQPAKSHLPQLALAWLALVGLTLSGLGLGEWAREFGWLPLVVALIMWIKGFLVARFFIESHLAHPFIANIVKVFVAFAPIALALTAFFGNTIARWASL